MTKRNRRLIRKVIRKVKGIAITLATGTIFCTTFLLACKFNHEDMHYYSVNGNVISFSSYHDNVTVEDTDGNLWQFYGTGYRIGDEVRLIMDDNGTTDIADDIVVEVKGR